MPRLRRSVAVLTAASLLVAACTTREQRIGAYDGSDACYQRRVQLDSTGDYFAEDIIRGAVIGAAGGAILGGLIAAATGGAGATSPRALASAP
jgi:outer membrane lipoprotein SlyB